MTPDIGTIVNLGIGGFAIWIMYLILKAFQQATEKKDTVHSEIIKEKDRQLMIEIEKRDKRNDEQKNIFTEYTMKIHESTIKQLDENTRVVRLNTEALSENTRVMRNVTEHLNLPPVINQIKVDGK